MSESPRDASRAAVRDGCHRGRLARSSGSSASWSWPPSSARRSWATPSSRPTRSPTCSSSCVAAGALSAVLVPAFVELLDAAATTTAPRTVAGGVLGVALVGLGAIALVGVLVARCWPALLTLGVPDEVADRAARARHLPAASSSCRRWCSTPAARSRPACCTPSAGSSAAAAAPMANTVVMVVCLLAFRAVAGSDAGLDLSTRRAVPARGRRAPAASSPSSACCWSRAAVTGLPAAAHGSARTATRGSSRLLHQAGWGVVLHTLGGRAAGRGDRGRRRRRGRRGRLPGGLGVLPGPVRDLRPADPDRDPPRARHRGPRRHARPLRHLGPLGDRAHRAAGAAGLGRRWWRWPPRPCGSCSFGAAANGNGPELLAAAARRPGHRPVPVRRCSSCWPGPTTPSATAGRPARSPSRVAAVGAGIMVVGAAAHRRHRPRSPSWAWPTPWPSCSAPCCSSVGLRRRTGHPVIVAGGRHHGGSSRGGRRRDLVRLSGCLVEHLDGRVGDLAVVRRVHRGRRRSSCSAAYRLLGVRGAAHPPRPHRPGRPHRPRPEPRPRRRPHGRVLVIARPLRRIVPLVPAASPSWPPCVPDGERPQLRSGPARAARTRCPA